MKKLQIFMLIFILCFCICCASKQAESPVVPAKIEKQETKAPEEKIATLPLPTEKMQVPDAEMVITEPDPPTQQLNLDLINKQETQVPEVELVAKPNPSQDPPKQENPDHIKKQEIQAFSNQNKKIVDRSNVPPITLTPWKELSGHLNPVWAVAFSPDGKIVASASKDQTIKIWDMESGKELKTLKGHQNQVQSLSFHPQGKILASADTFTVKLWSLEIGQELKSIPTREQAIYGVPFSPNGSLVAIVMEDHVEVWSWETEKEVASLVGGGYAFDWSPDGQIAAFRRMGTEESSPEKIGYWAVSSKETYDPWEPPHKAPDYRDGMLGHSDQIWRLCFSPHSKLLASGSKDKTVRLWDVETGKEITTFTGHKETVISVAFSPDGKYLVSSGLDGMIKLWSLEKGKERLLHSRWLVNIQRQKQTISTSLSFSPQGEFLATGGSDGLVRIWKAQKLSDREANPFSLPEKIEANPEVERYIDKDWGFSMEVPDGWESQKGMKIMGNTIPGLSLIPEELLGNMEKMVAMLVNTDKTPQPEKQEFSWERAAKEQSAFPEYQEQSRGEFTMGKISGKWVAQSGFSLPIGPENYIKTWIVGLRQGDRIATVHCMVAGGDFSEYQKAFMNAIASFRFE